MQEIVKKAADYINDAKNLTVEAEVEFDIAVSENLLAEYHGVLNLQMSRPNGFVLDYQDAAENTKIWFDGKSVTYLAVESNHYAVVPGAKSNAQTVSALYQDYGIRLPLTRLLFSDPHFEIMASGEGSDHLGMFKMNGHDVHHVAIHSGAADIQLWIDAGETPMVRKISILDRSHPLHPRYSARFSRFERAEQLDDAVFTATLPDKAAESKLTPISKNSK